MVPIDKVSFQHSFSVEPQHIDDLNHVNNVVYLQWVQEIASMHWDILASKEMKDSHIWMVLRHEIEYLGQAYLNDEISVYTWIDETHGVKSTRIVHVYANQKLLTTAKTTFCLLDKTTLKPKRVGADILQLFKKGD